MEGGLTWCAVKDKGGERVKCLMLRGMPGGSRCDVLVENIRVEETKRC